MCQRRAQIIIETAVIYSNFPPNTAGSNPVITTDVMNLNLQGETNIKKGNYDHFNVVTVIHQHGEIGFLAPRFSPWYISHLSSPSKQSYPSCLRDMKGGSRFPKAYY